MISIDYDHGDSLSFASFTDRGVDGVLNSVYVCMRMYFSQVNLPRCVCVCTHSLIHAAISSSPQRIQSSEMPVCLSVVYLVCAPNGERMPARSR